MAAPFVTAQLASTIANRLEPTVTFWSRLEGRPRTERFERALQAEVRDALWMLTRQWQLGEFRGDDAGSPILARLHVETTRLTKYRADGGAVEPFDESVPLETEVERRPLPITRGARELALDLRLVLGRHWLKLIGTLPGVDVAAATAQFLARYRITSPDPTVPADAAYCAQAEVWSMFAAASRRLDGGALYLYLREDPAHHAWDGIAALAGHEAEVDTLAARFLAWFDALIAPPPATGRDAWVPNRLEYQFAVSAPETTGEKVLVAEEYFHGHLDWYLDVDDSVRTLGRPSPPDPALPGAVTLTVLPTPLVFDGMPNTRWWTFEDGRTDFGAVQPDTTDLPRLLLMEFGLVYANDWFLLPCTLPAGALVRLRGIAVTNVFGERTWVEPAGTGADQDWQRWGMFLVSRRGQEDTPADTSLLLLLPTAAKVQEGAPLEEVLLVRDEVANMVWAIEQTIWLPTGEPGPGAEAARDLRAFLERDLARRLGGVPPAPPPTAETAGIRYRLMNTVPEQWIPFIPVHVPGDVREIQLQRAALPRILEGDPERPRKVQPRTALMREGLDAMPPYPYLLHEEEVPRAGVRITQAFQRTRWRDGRAWVWLGVRKQTGRGESSSGLKFDTVEPAVRPPSS